MVIWTIAQRVDYNCSVYTHTIAFSKSVYYILLNIQINFYSTKYSFKIYLFITKISKMLIENNQKIKKINTHHCILKLFTDNII